MERYAAKAEACRCATPCDPQGHCYVQPTTKMGKEMAAAMATSGELCLGRVPLRFDRRDVLLKKSERRMWRKCTDVDGQGGKGEVEQGVRWGASAAAVGDNILEVAPLVLGAAAVGYAGYAGYQRWKPKEKYTPEETVVPPQHDAHGAPRQSRREHWGSAALHKLNKEDVSPTPVDPQVQAAATAALHEENFTGAQPTEVAYNKKLTKAERRQYESFFQDRAGFSATQDARVKETIGRVHATLGYTEAELRELSAVPEGAQPADLSALQPKKTLADLTTKLRNQLRAALAEFKTLRHIEHKVSEVDRTASRAVTYAFLFKTLEAFKNGDLSAMGYLASCVKYGGEGVLAVSKYSLFASSVLVLGSLASAHTTFVPKLLARLPAQILPRLGVLGGGVGSAGTVLSWVGLQDILGMLRSVLAAGLAVPSYAYQLLTLDLESLASQFSATAASLRNLATNVGLPLAASMGLILGATLLFPGVALTTAALGVTAATFAVGQTLVYLAGDVYDLDTMEAMLGRADASTAHAQAVRAVIVEETEQFLHEVRSGIEHEVLQVLQARLEDMLMRPRIPTGTEPKLPVAAEARKEMQLLVDALQVKIIAREGEVDTGWSFGLFESALNKNLRGTTLAALDKINQAILLFPSNCLHSLSAVSEEGWVASGLAYFQAHFAARLRQAHDLLLRNGTLKLDVSRRVALTVARELLREMKGSEQPYERPQVPEWRCDRPQLLLQVTQRVKESVERALRTHDEEDLRVPAERLIHQSWLRTLAQIVGLDLPDKFDEELVQNLLEQRAMHASLNQPRRKQK